ncbi:MAG: hypothetical protein WD035_10610 [Balneolaceae bacterium]
MSYPDFQGLPPELSYFAGGPDSEDMFDLKFTFGSGGNRVLQIIGITPGNVREMIS